MKNANNSEGYDWLGIAFLTPLMYLGVLWPFILNSVGPASIFAVLFIWAIAYERGLKSVWKIDGDKKMAIFIFFIPSAIGLFSIFYTVSKWIELE